MKRWLLAILLLVPAAGAAPEHETAFVDAFLQVDIPLDLSGGVAHGTATLQTAQPGVQGCHNSGLLDKSDEEGWLRFQETKSQDGCGEWRIPIALPSMVEEATLHFRADRQIEQASTQEDLQLPISAPQRVILYHNGTVVDQDAYYGFNQPQEPARLPHNVPLPVEQLGREFEIGWYWEDTGDGSSFTTGTVTGTGFQSRVSNVRIDVSRVAVNVTPITTIASTVEGLVQTDTLQMGFQLSTTWLLSGQATLTLELTDNIAATRLTLPGGGHVAADQWEHQQSGGRQKIIIPGTLLSEIGGLFVLDLSGTTVLPEPAGPTPPARLPALLWLALFVPFAAGVLASAGHERVRRVAGGDYRVTVSTRLVVLALLWLIFVAFALYAWVFEYDAMVTLVLQVTSLALYVALAAVCVGFLLHFSMGILQARAFIDQRQAEVLERKNEALARSNRDLEQFAYVASHDLQEPLRKVATFTNLLQERYGDSLDAKGVRYVESANVSAVRARQLIQDLLAFSRIGAGDTMERVALDTVCAEALTELEHLIQTTGTRMATEPLPAVRGSSPLLVQLLINLIGNAIKYRHPQRDCVVRIHATQSGKHHLIHVSDNGSGIAPEDQVRVFQLFSRLENHAGVQGTGIGLAICQRIAEAHDGKLSVASDGVTGTTFTLRLPMDASVSGART